MDLGSYQWSEASNGLLKAAERRRLIRNLLQGQLHQAMQALLYRLKPAAKRRHIELTALQVPDTAWLNELSDYVAEQQSDVMTLHCLRTWAFGWIVGQAFNLPIDDEAFYSACLMHDLGLTPGCQSQLADNAFQVTSARQAYKVCRQHQSPAFAERVYEAISQHLNPWLNRKHCSDEAFLLKTGAHMDVIGAYHFWLTEAELQAVHRCYPRTGFAAEITTTMESLAHHRCSHAGVLNRLGFPALVAKNPLNQRF